MRRILQVFYAIFSAFITSLAIQNELLLQGSPFLGLFALVPLYLAFTKCQSYHEAGLLLGLQMSIVNLISSFWLGNFKGFAIFSLGGTTAAYLIFGIFLGQIIYLAFEKNSQKTFSNLNGTNSSDVIFRILYFASMWTVLEWLKSSGFLAYPWGTLSMTAYKWRLLTQIASITGVFGITFLFALFAAVIGEGINLLPDISHRFKSDMHKTYSRCGALCITLFTLATLFGVYSITSLSTPAKKFNAVIVQQNVDSWGTNESTGILISQKITDKVIAESTEKPDLIIWSEAVLERRMPRNASYYRRFPSENPLIPYIEKTDIPFIIGGPAEIEFFGKSRSSNSALYFDDDGNFLDSYGKRWLVPFAEIIPYSQYEWMQNFMRKMAGFSSSWIPGAENKIFSLDLGRNKGSVFFSTPICFEDAFPPICHQMAKDGAEVFVNITNDSWSRTKSAEYQHFVVASYRSIEFRTTMIRCANSGYSVVLDPTGKIIADLPLFEETGTNVEIPVYQRTLTPYSVLGNWLPGFLAILCGAYAIVLAFKRIAPKPIYLLKGETVISARSVSFKRLIGTCIWFLILIIASCLPITNSWYNPLIKVLIVLCSLRLVVLLKTCLFHRLVLTNKRIILVHGILRQKTTDMPLSKIETIRTTFGNICVKGVAGTKIKFKKADEINSFRLRILELL